MFPLIPATGLPALMLEPCSSPSSKKKSNCTVMENKNAFLQAFVSISRLEILVKIGTIFNSQFTIYNQFSSINFQTFEN